MSDEPFYSPTATPAPARVAKPGEGAHSGRPPEQIALNVEQHWVKAGFPTREPALAWQVDAEQPFVFDSAVTSDRAR